MGVRQDNSTEIDFYNSNFHSDRAETRRLILSKWIEEVPNTKYRYFVEQLSDGSRVYLERPGRLNKGCDFVIYCENHPELEYYNGNDKPPTHLFILDDLEVKKSILNIEQWQILTRNIRRVFNLEDTSAYLADMNDLPLTGLSYEVVLKLLKWFFIEQDLTYWSGQGREMLFNEINSI